MQLTLPFDGTRGDALDTALDAVRERFGSASITRAVLVDQAHVPTLEDVVEETSRTGGRDRRRRSRVPLPS